jgi:hypothetical protein
MWRIRIRGKPLARVFFCRGCGTETRSGRALWVSNGTAGYSELGGEEQHARRSMTDGWMVMRGLVRGTEAALRSI